jgi:hypothetical protein
MWWFMPVVADLGGLYIHTLMSSRPAWAIQQVQDSVVRKRKKKFVILYNFWVFGLKRSLLYLDSTNIF